MSALEHVPGSAIQVYNGWVWYTSGGFESFKSSTKEKCEENALWYFDVKCKSDPEAFLAAMQSDDR